MQIRVQYMFEKRAALINNINLYELKSISLSRSLKLSSFFFLL